MFISESKTILTLDSNKSSLDSEFSNILNDEFKNFQNSCSCE